jgi:hypothetical protein
MSEPNPYQPPSDPARAVHTAEAVAPSGPVSARSVDAGRGWDWIASGFDLFKKAPGIWILTIVIFFVCSIVIGIIPVIGPIANIIVMQIFVGGLMLGCRALDAGESLEIGHLFAGFSSRTSDLVVLGLLTIVGWFIAVIPALLIVGGGAFVSMMSGGSPAAQFGAMGVTFMLGLLLALALAVPLYMALWFAPALVVLNGLKPVEAMKASFVGCLKNIVPFLLYGVVMIVLCIVAAIPAGLGFLVLGPVAVASMYTGYRDIFAPS